MTSKGGILESHSGGYDYFEYRTIYNYPNSIFNGKITKVAAGTNTTFLASDVGYVNTYDINKNSGLGIKKDGEYSSPVDITGLIPSYSVNGVILLAANKTSAFIGVAPGIVYSIGGNESRNLGNGYKSIYYEPTEVTDLYK